MLKKIQKYARRILWDKHDRCYASMESTGYAVNGCCGGLCAYSGDVGNDLDPQCSGCSHYVESSPSK